MKRVLVFNGWAAGAETWELCSFHHDWIFNYIEQLDALPENTIVNFDEVILIGFSMGGSTALRMLLKFPEKVKGLILISATPRMMEDKERGWKGLSERRLNALELGTRMLFKEDPSPIYGVENMMRGIEYLKNTDLRTELLAHRNEWQKLRVSIFQSDRDGIVRPENARFLTQVFPHATLTMITGNEHVLPIKTPELIDQAVERMIDET